MLHFLRFYILTALFMTSIIHAAVPDVMTIRETVDNEIVVVADPQIHVDFGLTYPVTYELCIPQNQSDLIAFTRTSVHEDWSELEIKTSDDFFNAIEVARFDYDNHLAFVSCRFQESDTLYLKLENQTGQTVAASFNQVCKYYDNRDATVVLSADDFADWCLTECIEALTHFRSFNLWVSTAVITDFCSTVSYLRLQMQLDAGNVEASAHSRTHPKIPYEYPEYEITGCKEDLLNYLEMPELFCNGDKEYVYTWIAPYGARDEVIDSLVGLNDFLGLRLYYETDFYGFPEWDDQLGYFEPFGVTMELGPVKEGYQGNADSTLLNNAFDQALANESVYHLVCHHNILEWDKDYTWSHLNHISNRKNVWYACIGHLLVYRLASEGYILSDVEAPSNSVKTVNFSLKQNFPNPFNPTTEIEYNLEHHSQVCLKVFDMTGRTVAVLVDSEKSPGEYRVTFDGSNLSSGVYIYQLDAENQVLQKKCLLIK